MMDMKNMQKTPSDFQVVKTALNECFSFNGSLGRMLFFDFMLFGSLFYSLLELTEIPYLNILGWFCYFYIALCCYQKRCRDLNIKGTWIILITSLFFIIYALSHFLNIARTDILFSISKIIFLIYLGVYFYAQFMPGKKEKNPELISPLLKHPNIYFAVCVLIFALGLGILKNL